MEPSEYEKKAQEVANKIGIDILSAHQGHQCPPWVKPSEAPDHYLRTRYCKECASIHGEKYRVTIRRKDKRKSISFDFWASWADCNATALQLRNDAKLRKRLYATSGGGSWMHEPDSTVFRLKHVPSCYDILSCISSDASMPTDPDEVHDELGGGITPSQCQAIADFARKLHAFFTQEELALLAEVQ